MLRAGELDSATNLRSVEPDDRAAQRRVDPCEGDGPPGDAYARRPRRRRDEDLDVARLVSKLERGAVGREVPGAPCVRQIVHTPPRVVRRPEVERQDGAGPHVQRELVEEGRPCERTRLGDGGPGVEVDPAAS